MRTYALLAVVLCAACGPATAEFVRRPELPIAWPDAASVPRVELEFAYHDGEDAERHGGFLGGLGRLLTGASTPALVAPYGLALSADGWLYVADSGAGGVHALELASGEHRLLRGDEQQRFQTPIGVALAPDGRIFVTDSSAGCVHVLTREGASLALLGSPQELGRPTGIVCDAPRRRMLITDTTGCRLLVLDLDTLTFSAHGRRGEAPGEFNYPTNLALDGTGRVYVTDSLNFRVQVLSSELAPLAAFGRAGTGPGCFAKPKGIALDSQGHVYVADGLFENVQVFDAAGTLLLTFGSSGGALGELALPTGLAFDGSDRLYVADAGNARVQVFRFRSAP
ncbi:MAG: hypothetical protein ABL998_07345 [Planctomycetota bacterium]